MPLLVPLLVALAAAPPASEQAAPAVANALLTAAGMAVVVLVLGLSVRYLVRPGENDPDHIKRRILRDDDGEPR